MGTMMNVIEFNHVWKKFKRGEKFNSLRDAVPYYARLFFSGKIKTDNDGLGTSEFWSVENVSFNVAKGDILGIIGPNGAGKSTILKLLSKIMEPTRGGMRINGRLSALIEVTAGFHPDLTGKENIYLNGTILGMSRKEIDRKFDEIVAFSGLGEFVDTPVKRYSSGMFSRLGFSVAAHMDPDILLVDEVLSVGDIAFQSKCTRKMKELLSSGATIVLVTHDLALVQNMCKRVLLLSSGRLLREGSTDEIIPYYQDIVARNSEAELKRELKAHADKVRVHDDVKVSIQSVQAENGARCPSDRFKVGDHMSLKLRYEAKEPIESPVFFVEVIRSDSVVCCSSNSRVDGFATGTIVGQGTIGIDMGDLHLAPGIYVIKLSVWDSGMLHPFTVRKQDIIRIESKHAADAVTGGVFLRRFTWHYSIEDSMAGTMAAGGE